jgi:hypothetical protein
MSSPHNTRYKSKNDAASQLSRQISVTPTEFTRGVVNRTSQQIHSTALHLVNNSNNDSQIEQIDDVSRDEDIIFLRQEVLSLRNELTRVSYFDIKAHLAIVTSKRALNYLKCSILKYLILKDIQIEWSVFAFYSCLMIFAYLFSAWLFQLNSK